LVAAIMADWGLDEVRGTARSADLRRRRNRWRMLVTRQFAGGLAGCRPTHENQRPIFVRA
jgi:hypothetical protein